MKKSIIKVSTLGLSTLLVACGGGGGGAANAPADNAAQPINPQVQAQPQTQSQTPPKASEKAKEAPKAEANVSEENKKNPTEPTVQVSSSQPRAVSVTPKAENRPNVEEPAQSQGRHKRDVAEMNQSRTNVWTGRCESKNFCSVDQKDKIKIYEVNTQDNSKAGTSLYEKTTEKEMTLSLVNSKSGDNYNFTLLSDNENNAMAYYGYRERASQSNAGRYYDFLYATNPEFSHSELPAQFSASYTKDNGFIYAPVSASSESNNQLKRQGNVVITYKNGIVTGAIYEPSDKTHAIFDITGKGANLVIESTEHVPSPISPKEKGVIQAHFIDSRKGEKDYKYLLGAGKSEESSGKNGWVGVIFAERKDK